MLPKITTTCTFDYYIHEQEHSHLAEQRTFMSNESFVWKYFSDSKIFENLSSNLGLAMKIAVHGTNL